MTLNKVDFRAMNGILDLRLDGKLLVEGLDYEVLRPDDRQGQLIVDIFLDESGLVPSVARLERLKDVSWPEASGEAESSALIDRWFPITVFDIETAGADPFHTHPHVPGLTQVQVDLLTSYGGFAGDHGEPDVQHTHRTLRGMGAETAMWMRGLLEPVVPEPTRIIRRMSLPTHHLHDAIQAADAKLPGTPWKLRMDLRSRRNAVGHATL